MVNNFHHHTTKRNKMRAHSTPRRARWFFVRWHGPRSKSAIVKRSPRVDPRRARVRQHERALRRRRYPRTTRTRDTARGSGSPPPPHVPRDPPNPRRRRWVRKTDSATRSATRRVEKSNSKIARFTSVFEAKRRTKRFHSKRRDETYAARRRARRRDELINRHTRRAS